MKKRGIESKQDKQEESGEAIAIGEKYEMFRDRVPNGKQQVQITSEVEGINPEWNELIEFKIGKIRENEKFDPEDVINSRNKLVLTLFDQIGTIR